MSVTLTQSAKTPPPILLTDDGISIFSSSTHPENTLDPIYSRLPGKLHVFKAAQSAKQLFSMLVRLEPTINISDKELF